MSDAAAIPSRLDPALFGEGPARDSRFTVVEVWADMVNLPSDHPQNHREFLHRQMNEEACVMENAARSLAEFTDAEWKVRKGLARQCADEARHVLNYRRLLEARGGFLGEYPVMNFQYRILGRIDSLVGRLSVQNRSFEAEGLDAATFARDEARQAGDHELADMYDAQQADEVCHIRFANEHINQEMRRTPRIGMTVRPGPGAGDLGLRAGDRGRRRRGRQVRSGGRGEAGGRLLLPRRSRSRSGCPRPAGRPCVSADGPPQNPVAELQRWVTEVAQLIHLDQLARSLLYALAVYAGFVLAVFALEQRVQAAPGRYATRHFINDIVYTLFYRGGFFSIFVLAGITNALDTRAGFLRLNLLGGLPWPVGLALFWIGGTSCSTGGIACSTPTVFSGPFTASTTPSRR